MSVHLYRFETQQGAIQAVVGLVRFPSSNLRPSNAKQISLLDCQTYLCTSWSSFRNRMPGYMSRTSHVASLVYLPRVKSRSRCSRRCDADPETTKQDFFDVLSQLQKLGP